MEGQKQNMRFNEETLILFAMLSEILNNKTGDIPKWEPCKDWHGLLQLAQTQGVLPLLYDTLKQEKTLPESLWKVCRAEAIAMTRKSYHLLFYSRRLIRLLEEGGVNSVLLKGMTIAVAYPVPELRKSGDIDLLLTEPKDLRRAEEILKAARLKVYEEQHANHHLVFLSEDGKILIELHTMLAEAFDDDRINRYLKELIRECGEQCEMKSLIGVECRVLKPGFQAYQLLLHMLHHFLRAGFGLKLLCDWVCFWNPGIPKEEKEIFLRLIRESGMEGFAAMVTAACKQYLGMEQKVLTELQPQKKEKVEDFLLDILEGGEYGETTSGRMVVLKGNRLWDYVREFHHQMHLNFPRMGKVFLFWPILWTITLFRFLNNNRKLNRGSGMAILKSAGKRSSLIKDMHLFDSEEAHET